MDLVSLFTKEKDIAGLEISDDFLRLALLRRNYEKKGNVYIKELAEEPLEAGVVVSGVLKNQDKFVAALNKLLTKVGAKIDYAIVSIPHLNLYSKVFSFPKSVGAGKLNEAMKVTVNFNLPVKPEAVYIDWEEVHVEGKNELMLATVSKEIVNSFTKALEASKITPIAFESHALSLIRILEADTEKPALLILKDKNHTGFIILKNGAIRFSKFAGRSMAQAEIDLEVKKISSFYEADKEPIAKTISQEEITLPKKFANYSKVKEEADSNKWLIVLGAGMRGLLPASEDKLISLMAVGTEEAFAKQERVVFAKLLGDVTTFIAIFITLSFLAVWLIMVSVKNSVDAQVSITAVSISNEAQQIEARAAKLNSVMGILLDIDSKSPRFSIVLEEIRTKTIAGITIMTVSIPGPEAVIQLNGVAAQRKDISAFRTSVASSNLFTEVVSPPSNLDKRTDIPFTMTFRLKDSSVLYRKAQ